MSGREGRAAASQRRIAPMMRTLFALSIFACVAGCGGRGGDVDAGLGADAADDAGSADDGGVDAPASDDAGAGEDAGLAQDGGDSGTIEVDGGADSGPPAPMRTACSVDGDCGAGRLCVAGLCRVSTTTTSTAMGLASITRMIAASDLDGTLRLVTDTGTTTFDVVGPPGALVATMGVPASDMYPLREEGRSTGTRAHASWTSGDYRWVIVDQMAAVEELRPIYFQDTAHARDGTLYVITTPRYPRGPSDLTDPYPLHLWSPGPSGYELEELVRNVGTTKDLHLRIDASDGPEVLQTDAFRIFRWTLGATGWSRAIIHTFSPMPSREGYSLWMDDAAGHTHVLHVLFGATDTLEYVEVDDAAIVREVDMPGVVSLAGDLQIDDAGDVYFLDVGTGSSPDRRPFSLHRIAADGTTSSTVVGTLRTDLMQRVALAVQPDGDAYVFLYAPARAMEIIELRLP
jgi:hypothetical protein